MAAYAALLSVMHIIDQIKHHPRPPISLDESHVQTLMEKVTFLQDFLELYSHAPNEEADGLQLRIAKAAYAAEDVIESHIVDQIIAQSTTHEEERISSDVGCSSCIRRVLTLGAFLPHLLRRLLREESQHPIVSGDNISNQSSLLCREGMPSTSFQAPPQICAPSSSSVDFYQGLQKVTGDMDLIKKEVMEIKEKMGSAGDIQLQGSGFVPIADSSGSPLKGQNIMVGFGDVLIQLMAKLTGQRSNRQIIPIVGMGGIGKTTLAINAYENPLIVQYFYVRAWVTISQEYSMKEILLQVISCLKNQENIEDLRGKSEEKLGELLHKSLYGRRYLIIMDDMWSIEAWNKVKFFLPDNNNGSRVIITTRLSNIALHLPSATGIEMGFLDEELSWNLLSKIVFGDTECPLTLEDIGRTIAINCKGLPLSIIVIGGLLAKSKWTREHWENIANNLNSIVNLEDNERCLKLLYMSYNHLPVHLKPCFLYLGVFPEDSEIHVSKLIKQWIAEGFLKPIIDKSLEEVGEEYLNDLIDRNLILTLKSKFNEKMKYCKIHDLVRDLCLREAQTDNFFCVTGWRSLYNSSHEIYAKHRIVVDKSTLEEENEYYLPEMDDAPHSLSLARSLTCKSSMDLSSFNFKLLRLFEAYTHQSLGYTLLHGVNLRYIAVPKFYSDIENLIAISGIPSFFYLLWNLQTLIARSSRFNIRIWKMPLLRHVELNKLYLPDPSEDFSSYCSEQNDFILENLQMLSNVMNFRCSEHMVKTIPNIKKLKITYEVEFEGSHYCLNNLARLQKLEFLNLCFRVWARPSRRDLMQNLVFPDSLKKLTLEGSKLQWEDISTKIGSLPLLQVLKLRQNSFIGPKWNTVEGQFLNLKILLIDGCGGLEQWASDSTHFPLLEHLVLKGLYRLKEIPLSFVEISTLQSIRLKHCSDSAIFSAKEIVEEQEQLGNESLRILLTPGAHNRGPKSLASHNFQVKDPWRKTAVFGTSSLHISGNLKSLSTFGIYR